MASYKITLAAINRAVEAAGPQAEAVAEILFMDIGRPLPSKAPPVPGEPFSTYDSGPKGTFNAEVEGADVPETEPLTTETSPDDSRSQSGQEG